MIAAIADHVWQSTLVAVVVALLTASLRANRPHLRYRLWLAASLKFLLPVAAVTATASRLAAWAAIAASPPVAGTPLALVVERWDAIGQPFSRPGLGVAPSVSS